MCIYWRHHEALVTQWHRINHALTARLLKFMYGPGYPELIISKLKNEPQHDKSNKMTCAPSEDSDQPGHPPNLIRVFPHEENLGPWLPFERTANTDQTGQMSRLIWVLAGRTGHFVGFVMLLLKHHDILMMIIRKCTFACCIVFYGRYTNSLK